MKTQTYYIVVGAKTKPVQGRIVGKLLEVMTPFGIVEQSRWFKDESNARLFINARKRNRLRVK